MKRHNPEPKAAPSRLRCAIYTRKSTEEGLEQEFSSLDAQREAAEAFIQSQKREGWIALPDHYDDGGFTGANMDRPALKRLLTAVEAGKLGGNANAGLADLFGTYGGSTAQLNSNNCTVNTLWNPTVFTSISLPNFQQYQLKYNDYGEVGQIVLPTGGSILYTYGAGDSAGSTPSCSQQTESGGVDLGSSTTLGDNPFVYRRVLTRDVSADGGTIEQHTAYSVNTSTYAQLLNGNYQATASHASKPWSAWVGAASREGNASRMETRKPQQNKRL